MSLRTNATEWTDGLGSPRARPDIKRILCLKVDHIGDLLVADLALRLLRKFFPDSHITLVCGEWNVELAQKLGLAQIVIGVALFHQQGAAQHDREIAASVRQAGIARLLEVAGRLPEFDLAIDLRIDEDTRDLLKLFKAKVYAGSGDLETYPFLDISIPMSRTHPNEAAKALRLSAYDFTEVSGYAVTSLGVGCAPSGLVFPVRLAIAGARSPAECGTNAADKRMLGIGLLSVSLVASGAPGAANVVREFDFRGGSGDCQFLKQGWSGPEPWGTWSVAAEATLTLADADGDVVGERNLVFRFRAHLNPQNKVITVTATDLSSNTSAVTTCEFPAGEFELSLPIKLGASAAFARSRAVNLCAGHHCLSVEALVVKEASGGSLKVSLLGTRPERTIATSELQADSGTASRKTLELDFVHRDSEEALHVLLESGVGQAAGLYVHSIASRMLWAAPARVPAAHMEKLMARLVTAVALEFSPFFLEFGLAPEERFKAFIEISRPAPDRPLAAYCALVAAKKSTCKVVGLSIGATKETKRWPFGYMLEFCESLLGRPDVYLVLLGGPTDIADTARLEHALGEPGRVLNFCGQTGLADFATAVSPVDLYIGYDTGTTHYAGRVGVRTVGIFSAAHSPREWGPVGRHASWITHYTQCSPCYLASLDDCRFGHACMLDLRPSECWKIVTAILDEVPARA